MEVEDDNDDFDPPLPITNYFVYKGKKYPFNFSLFKIFSQFFSTVESEVTSNPCINLIEEDKCPIALSEDYIQYFVNYCQKIPIPKDKINCDSASTLHYLANYYKVKSLISRMEKYFKQNQEEFVIYFLSNPDAEYLNQERYETMLSDKLLEYINRPELLSLSVPVLHRVLTKYQLKYNKENKSQPELAEFLFKYLDEHGIESSCLFSFIDLSQEKSEYLYRLLHDYSKSFDFHFINSSLMKTLYDIENEFIETKQIIDTKQNDTLTSISEKIDNFEQIKNDLIQQKDQIKGEIDQMKSDLTQIKEDIKKQIEDEISGFKNEINKLQKEAEDQFELKKNEIEKMKNDMKSEIDQMKSDMKNEINQLTTDIKNSTDHIKTQIIKDFKDDQTQLKNEVNQLVNDVRDEIRPVKDDLNQFKTNSEENFLNTKEENEKLKKQVDQLKRIIYDIDSSSYFEKSDNIETFNNLYGESQQLIVEGIVRKNRNASQCMKNINDLLLYLLNEQKKSNKPPHLTSFININAKEKLANLSKVDFIEINCDIIDMLHENKSLYSGDLANIISKFDNFYVEIQYPSDNYDSVYNYFSNLKKRIHQLKISIYFEGKNQTDRKFKDNNEISMIKIGPSVTHILGGLHNGSFENCKSLEKVVISNSVKTIGGGAFSSCSNLKQLVISDSVETIQGGAFSECSSLVEVMIPSSVNKIDQVAFEKCRNLQRLIINPYQTKFETNTFQSCPNIKCLIFESTVSAINKFDYDKCWKLTEIIIPESVTSIQEGALSNCSSLEKLTIPSSIKYLCRNIFNGCCQTLNTITFDPYSTRFESNTFGDCTKLKNLVLYSSVTFTQEFDLFKIAKFTKITIPNSVTSIGAKSFHNYNCLEEIVISNSVVSIEYDAFYGCTKLTEVVIPDSVKYIAGGVFCNCTALKKVSMPNSVKSIGGGAFSLCSSLVNIDIPSSVVFVENDLCKKCTNLEKVKIPNSVTSIGAGAFSECSSLKEIFVPDSVHYIGTGAFYNCSKMVKARLSNSLTSIEMRTFKYCSSLNEVKDV